MPQSKADRQKELDNIRSRLTAVKKEITTLQSQEKNVKVEIDLLNEQVTLSRRLISELESSARATQKEIDSLEVEVSRLEREIEGSKDNLKKRLLSIYKRGQYYDLELIFGARSAAEVYDRIYFTRYAARAEERLFERLLATKDELDSRKSTLVSYSNELSALLGEKKSAEDSLVSARRSKEGRLNEIQGSKESKEKLVKELEERRRQLEKLLSTMDQQSSTSPDRKPQGTVIEKGRGTLPWPVSGHKIISSYGINVHPRYNTKTRNDGVDIDCSGGQTVKAINKGKVVYAENLTGYGLLVVIDHQDGYYTIYGNLDKISVKNGQAVTQGQSLGSASDYLHFEIRQGTSSRNPIDYLK